MQAAVLRKPGGLDRIETTALEPCSPQAGEVCVRIAASSLNFHDYAVANGSIAVPDGRVLMSDGAGEVVETGAEVSEFAVGDHVVSTFFPNWQDGAITPAKRQGTPGDSGEGMAAEYVTAPVAAFTRAPTGYSAQQAATLPCAALTAWRALMVEARIKPGDTVLTMGTGGVSIFALQFARAAGARVIATSSSNAKLERLRALGADATVNYVENPDWGKAVKELADGRGVDAVVEIGGPGTLAQSIAACRMGGHISLIGVLTGLAGKVPTAAFFYSNLNMTGITVGSRTQQQDMVRAIEASGIEPVIDRCFALDELAQAFRYQESGQHFGKIGITI